MLTALPQEPVFADVDGTIPAANRVGSSLRGGRIWVQEVLGAAAANRVRLRTIRARGNQRPLPAAEANELHGGTEELLCVAEKAAPGLEPRHRRIAGWWNGDCVETAFHNLHRAEAELVCSTPTRRSTRRSPRRSPELTSVCTATTHDAAQRSSSCR